MAQFFLKGPLRGHECAARTARARAIRPESKIGFEPPFSIFDVLGGFRTKNATSSSQDPRHHSFCKEPSHIREVQHLVLSKVVSVPKRESRKSSFVAALHRKEQTRFSLENRFCLAQILKIFRCAGLRRGAPPPGTPQSAPPSRTYVPVSPA